VHQVQADPKREGQAIATNQTADVVVGLVGVVKAEVEGTPEGEAIEMDPNP
jgi:hypothetical protein